ncbi:hypothetical protein CA13_53770 [Planctomycetes bacterium CA13]|uniref:Uncharacterized protein n=1 Tax=Novipirellula herctigrandis TaxID=2527986 RepID=A0A5C5ZBG5_9BACT|nr:hypothetical protein CA13_53770 [Planctomycetes bacterium CA13]
MSDLAFWSDFQVVSKGRLLHRESAIDPGSRRRLANGDNAYQNT